MELLSSLTKEEILEVLSHGLCRHCETLVHDRTRRTLHKRKRDENLYPAEDLESYGDAIDLSIDDNGSILESFNKRIRKEWKSPTNFIHKHDSMRDNKSNFDSSPKYLKERKRSDIELLLCDGIVDVSPPDNELIEERDERIRYSEVHCNKDFIYIERINGRDTNLLEGLELHSGVFNSTEQNEIVDYIYRLQRRGQQGRLRDRTYSKPRKWMRGKGRETLQFGCCYNYAVDKNGNPPGISRTEEVDPLPRVFKQMIKRMVRWNIIPPTCVPDSCIVNIYDVGDCIPPHIDHHDFVRPFYSVSFLNEAKILFGSNLKAVRPGEFFGPASISLPVGSVFVLKGNGADIAKHCIPSVSSKRISITFRKMDKRKLPYTYLPDHDLVGIKPLLIK